jgi:hypothetical protein
MLRAVFSKTPLVAVTRFANPFNAGCAFTAAADQRRQRDTTVLTAKIIIKQVFWPVFTMFPVVAVAGYAAVECVNFQRTTALAPFHLLCLSGALGQALSAVFFPVKIAGSATVSGMNKRSPAIIARRPPTEFSFV